MVESWTHMKCARRDNWEVDYLNNMRVFERVPHEVAKARMRKEPIKVRWVDTLKGSGIHRSRLVAKEFRRGSKYEGFAKFSATPPLELVKIDHLLGGDGTERSGVVVWLERTRSQ